MILRRQAGLEFRLRRRWSGIPSRSKSRFQLEARFSDSIAHDARRRMTAQRQSDMPRHPRFKAPMSSQSFFTTSPTRMVPERMTFALMPRSCSSRPCGELTNFIASRPKRSVNFLQPV